MFSILKSFFKTPSTPIITFRFLSCENQETTIKSPRILKENEILRFNDTGKFKVGDGVNTTENLPFSNTLPKEIQINSYLND